MTSSMTDREVYRGFEIVPTVPCPPIPSWRDHQWTWQHPEYDGAPDSGDSRFGTAASVEDAKAEIDNWYEMNYDRCPVCGYWAFNGEECFDCGYRPTR